MRRLIAVLLAAAAALACHGRSVPAQRTQTQYDVVQEGQSDTASSTIGAPGEVRPPATTATNTDTTSTFALGTAMPPANMPGGPAGGVLPPQQPAPTTMEAPPRLRPRRPPPPPITVTTSTTSTDTAATTDTTQTTDTSAPPPTRTDTIGNH